MNSNPDISRIKTPPVRACESGFTLIEILVSMTILAGMMLFFSSVFSTTSSTWSKGIARLENFQTGRATLELMEREMKPAVANPRVQFALTKGEILGTSNLGLVPNVAPGSHAAFCATPIGEGGSLVITGYYLYRDNAKGHFWLRRLYLNQDKRDASNSSPFPVILKEGATSTDSYEASADPTGEIRPHHLYANWFFSNLKTKHFDDQNPGANPKDICVSTLANGVVALWTQAFDQQGNPIPSLIDHPGFHPPAQQPILFNSASFLVQANTSAFENGNTALYTGLNPSRTNGKTLAFRAATVPTTVEITIVTLDAASLSRIDPASIPPQPTIYDTGVNGTFIDTEASAAQLTSALLALNIRDYRVFTKRVKLLNGGK